MLAEKWWQGDGDESPSLGWTLTKLDDNSVLLAVSGPEDGEVGARTDGGIIAPGVWYHVAARRSGSELAVLVNGKPRAGAELDSGIAWDLSSPDMPLSFGHRADERGYFVDGSIDEVQFFVGTAVPDEAIWSTFAAGASGTCRIS